MRIIICCIAILTFSNITVFGQDSAKLKDDFNKKLRKYRAENLHKEIKEDSLITKVVKYSSSENEFTRIGGKERMKGYLKGQGVYDYEIEIFNIKVKSDSIDFSQILSKSKQLEKAISNDEFNRIGVNVVQDKNNLKVQIILTKNYIDFHEVSYDIYAPNSHYAGVKIPSTVRIKGDTYLNSIYFLNEKELNKYSSSFKQIKRKNVTLEDQSFELLLEYDSEEIEFYDSEGNIIAKLSGFLK